MKMKLGLDLQASNNPLYMAVVADASVFTGHGQSMDDTGYVISSGGGAFYLLNFASEALVQLLQLGTQVAVIMRTISLSSPDTAITLGNVVLVGLSLAPTLLTLCQERFGTWLNPYNDEPRAVRLRSLQEESKTLENIGEGSKRQELLIFGYKDWVLQRWDKLEQLSLAEEGTTTRKLEYLSMVLEVLKTTVKSGFYVLLATQAIPTTLSLGAITLHGQMAEDLLSTSRRFAELFYVTYQMPFFLAAFFVAADGPQKLGPQLDYEAYRTPGGKGMRIEARNLSFTYPGASKPALHDINLVVEPGESLAIVGFNGGGKSTLVKTILGLNTFTGELRINNLHIDDYNAETMHKRMSCLFQDYARHRLSLRVNVGFGEASQMDDDAAIEHALGCGGATMVLEQVGSLESLLSTTSVEHNEPQKKEETRPTRTRGFGMVRFRRPRLPAEGLSGGQWQRVAISRAFMRADTADLVVFDEPSASLDPRAEAELFDRIHALSMRDGKRVTTTVFISHRFSTVRRADKIAFMENGVSGPEVGGQQSRDRTD